MSLFILIGTGIGGWALLSVVSGECLRQREARERQERTRELAPPDGEKRSPHTRP